MKKELLSFPSLRQYAVFLLDNHLDELVSVDLIRSRILDLPMLRLFNDNEEQLFEISKKSIKELLTNIVENNFYQQVVQSMQDWKENKLAIPRDKVVASDIALIYNVRKHSLITLLPQYTSDLHHALDIIREIEDFYTFQEELAIQTYSDIKQEELVINENRLKEAQKIARLGSWEWDIVTNEISWSDEMFRLFGYEPGEITLTLESYQNLLLPDDKPYVLEKIERCLQTLEPYTLEHRIQTRNGIEKWIHGKGEILVNSEGKALKLSGTAMDITEQKEKDALVQRSEQQLVDAQAIAQVGSFDYDIKCNNLVWTKELYRIFEIEPRVVITFQDFEKALHPDDLEKVREAVAKAFRDEAHFDLEYRIITPDRKEKNIWAKGKVYFNTEKKAIRFLGTAADITSRKELENKLKENEEKYRLLAEHSTDVISRHNRDGVYLYVSPSCKSVFGYTQEELLGKNGNDFIHPEDKKTLKRESIQNHNNSEIITVAYRFKIKDGSHIWIESCAQNIRDDSTSEIMEIQIASRDISKRKKAEEELQQKQIALLESNKELEAFSYTISHDLRSPLRAIDGFGRKLASQYENVLDKEGQRLLNIVRTSAQQMGVLIDSLLEFSRLNRKQIKKYAFNMERLVLKVIGDCKNQFPEVNPEFVIKTLVEAPADKELLNQVWHNIIANAMKFSAKVPHPVIEVGSEDQGNRIVYYVKDNGAGFEMAYKEKLYGVFQRLHSNEEFAGTGVGLATVQRIIHRHNGSVWAEGEPGKGAKFYFSLPVLVPESAITSNNIFHD